MLQNVTVHCNVAAYSSAESEISSFLYSKKRGLEIEIRLYLYSSPLYMNFHLNTREYLQISYLT